MAITIKATIEDFGLARRLRRAPSDVQRRAAKKVKSAGFAVEREIKQDMPVRTGRARASWGHWTPGDLEGQRNPQARASDAVWEMSDGGLTNTQGTNVEYVPLLNQGHSKQAEAGFIDRNAEKGARILEDEIREVVDGVL